MSIVYGMWNDSVKTAKKDKILSRSRRHGSSLNTP